MIKTKKNKKLKKQNSKQKQLQNHLDIEDQIIKSLKNQTTSKNFYKNIPVNINNHQYGIAPWNPQLLQAKQQLCENFSLPEINFFSRHNGCLIKSSKSLNMPNNNDRHELKKVTNKGTKLELKPILPVLKVSEYSSGKSIKMHFPKKLSYNELKIREQLKKAISVQKLNSILEKSKQKSEQIMKIKKIKSTEQIDNIPYNQYLKWKKNKFKSSRMNIARIYQQDLEILQ